MYRVIMGRSLPPAAVTPAWLHEILDDGCVGLAETEALRSGLLQARPAGPAAQNAYPHMQSTLVATGTALSEYRGSVPTALCCPFHLRI